MTPHRKPLSPVVPVPVRKIRDLTRLLLFVKAGGRCEFDGCNDYLLEDRVTLSEGVFGQMAHIVAFKPEGPRGQLGTRPLDINDVTNLMLLCPQHHKLIDDHPDDYTRATLEEYKRQHEKRIRYVTDLGPDRKTSVLILKAPIGGQTVEIPYAQIVEATSPRYPTNREGTTIDLRKISDRSSAFTEIGKETIEDQVRRFFEPGGEGHKAQHVSIFALGPIPLLVFFGRQLTNKVASDVFQRHRDTEDWTWKKPARPVKYVFRRRKAGDRGQVALILSLSGRIPLSALPDAVRRKSTVYELTVLGATPRPTYLRSRRDLEGFRMAYQSALAEIVEHHGLRKSIDLFPAIPAPVAVLCGRELLPKVHPRLRVHDYSNERGGFQFSLEV